MSLAGIDPHDFAALQGRYVRTRTAVDGHEPGTLGVIGPVQRDRQGRPQLAVYWRPDLQCAGEAAPSWYGPGGYALDDLELLPPWQRA